MKSRRPGAARWIPPVAYSLLLFGLSSIPGATDDADRSIGRLLVWMPPAVQNILHVPQYALLSWLWSRAGATPVVAALLSIAYAVFEEIYQLSVPGRYGSWTDLVLDGVGIAIGILWYRRRNRPAS